MGWIFFSSSTENQRSWETVDEEDLWINTCQKYGIWWDVFSVQNPTLIILLSCVPDKIKYFWASVFTYLCRGIKTTIYWEQTCTKHKLFFFSKNFFKKFIYLFYLWLCWVFVSLRGLSLVAASGGHSSSWCAGLSLSRPLLLWSTGSRRAGSVVVAQGSSCSAACGIFPDQGSNPCPLHWQADSQPLRHQGSPKLY